MDALHRGEIDHHPAVDGAVPGDVVTAAADGDLEIQRPRQLDGVRDVGGAMASRDQRRPLVDQAVVDASGLVVAHRRLAAETFR